MSARSKNGKSSNDVIDDRDHEVNIVLKSNSPFKNGINI